MDDPDVLTGVVADEEPACTRRGRRGRARGASSARVLARAGLIVTGAVPRVARPRLRPDHRLSPPRSRTSRSSTPFFAAFRIPDLLFQLVAAGALSSALIPVVAGLFATDEEARAWRVVSTVTTLMLSALLRPGGARPAGSRPQLVAVITPGFDEAQLAETTELTRIMVLSPLFLAAGAVATSVLNSRGRFAAAALAPLVYNLAIISAPSCSCRRSGCTGLAVGVVLGALGHVAGPGPVARAARGPDPAVVDLRDDQARTALLLMVPRAIGLGATQIVFLVMTSLASTLGRRGRSRSSTSRSRCSRSRSASSACRSAIVLLPSLSREAALGASEGVHAAAGRAASRCSASS